MIVFLLNYMKSFWGERKSDSRRRESELLKAEVRELEILERIEWKCRSRKEKLNKEGRHIELCEDGMKAILLSSPSLQVWTCTWEKFTKTLWSSSGHLLRTSHLYFHSFSLLFPFFVFIDFPSTHLFPWSFLLLPTFTYFCLELFVSTTVLSSLSPSLLPLTLSLSHTFLPLLNNHNSFSTFHPLAIPIHSFVQYSCVFELENGSVRESSAISKKNVHKLVPSFPQLLFPSKNEGWKRRVVWWDADNCFASLVFSFIFLHRNKFFPVLPFFSNWIACKLWNKQGDKGQEICFSQQVNIVGLNRPESWITNPAFSLVYESVIIQHFLTSILLPISSILLPFVLPWNVNPLTKCPILTIYRLGIRIS